MTIVRIQLPDEQAAALKAKATAQGLSLEGWFRKIAEEEAPACRPRYTLAELVEECDSEEPVGDEERNWMDAPPIGREAL